MEVVTGEQMARIDRYTIDELEIPGLELMETAGRAVALALLEDYPDAAERGVVILCGKGNNGGDGFVAARYLAQHGIKPHIVLLASTDQLRGEAAHNRHIAKKQGLDLRAAVDEHAWSNSKSLLTGETIVVDALLGTGVQGGARGLIGTVIGDLNESGCTVVSVDLPSGLDANATETDGVVVRAERTYTLCRPKLPLVLDPGATTAGSVRVLPIGIPDEAVATESTKLEWVERTTAAGLMPMRAAASHKGTHGHLLAVAGSRGKSGAAVLLARGALRSGLGLMTVATPEGCLDAVAGQQAEIMTEPLAQTVDGCLAAEAADAVRQLLIERDALAIGPGLGTREATGEAVRAIVGNCSNPLVIDADGLNLLAGSHELGSLGKGGRPVVLTPHPGEASRLLGSSSAEIQADRQAAARKLAELTGAVVILKGHQSLIARPDGLLAVNGSGNPGMATAGTGDVLTGVVGAYLARGLTGWDAARLGAYVHGVAGDRAAHQVGMDGMIASDLIGRLPATLNELRMET